MATITNEKEYYEALALTSELEDDVRKNFPLFKKLGYDLKKIAEFDIMSARELARQLLNIIEGNYSDIYGISPDKESNSPKSKEDMDTYVRQLETMSTFAKR